MSDFLWHKVSEKEKESIRKDAKRVMDSFSKKLSKIDEKKIPDAVIERDEDLRNEGEGKCGSGEFREVMFKNAPNKNKDFIIAEKKKW